MKHQKKSHLSKENQKRLAELKIGAHERQLEHDFINFRVNKPMIELISLVAKYKRQPIGIMIRNWVEQRLSQEIELLP